MKTKLKIIFNIKNIYHLLTALFRVIFNIPSMKGFYS